MGKHITNFDTTSQFASFSGTSNCLKPHVSLTNDDEAIHYIKDQYTGHDYIEIANTKWAIMNVGASSITDTGLFFQWGDTSGYTVAQVGSGTRQKYFGWSDYIYSNNDGTTMTKYNGSDGKVQLTSGDDAAIANWGGVWRTPTKEEYIALSNATNHSWTANYKGSGVSGIVLTDKTDSTKELFFPTVSYCYNGAVRNGATGMYYWTNSVYDRNNYKSAYVVWYDNGGGMDVPYTMTRHYGLPVRAVAD